jgi:hypothetical protein
VGINILKISIENYVQGKRKPQWSKFDFPAWWCWYQRNFYGHCPRGFCYSSSYGIAMHLVCCLLENYRTSLRARCHTYHFYKMLSCTQKKGKGRWK